MDWSVVLQIVVGALISAGLSAGFVIWMENLRKPELALRIEVPPVDVPYPSNRPAQTARYLRLIIENKELPRFARWLSRNAAIRCHGLITFHHLDGQNVFGRSIQARWAGSPEPVPLLASVGQQQIRIIDPARLSPERYTDIHAGAPAVMDIAARFDSDVDCYGWSNESYFSTPPWRNPSWRLGADRYLVKVDIIYSGSQCSRLYRLVNDVPVRDFRLEEALPNDVVR
jgi:hypothetical protein